MAILGLYGLQDRALTFGTNEFHHNALGIVGRHLSDKDRKVHMG